MTPQLTQTPPDSTERTDDRPFPYADDRPGFPLGRPRARAVLRPTDGSDAIGASGSLDCPACGTETINGAGLFTCPDCSWDGLLR